MPQSRSKRVLLYSHDSFGLGHVSRCRTIANAIVEAAEGHGGLIFLAAERCIKKALLGAKVPPFAQTTYMAPVTIRPN